MKSDQELVVQTQHGDMGAAAELIRRYESAVYASVYAISADHHAAEDVTQEAFVMAINQLKTLNEPARFGGWLLTIAKRMAIRAQTRQKRYSSFPPTPVPRHRSGGIIGCWSTGVFRQNGTGNWPRG